MNILKKLYCRTYQIVFRIALPILPYHTPKIINKIEALPAVLAQKNKNKVLIVTDFTVRDLGLTRSLEEALKAAQIEFYYYDKTVANPTTLNVEQAAGVYKKHNCQAIIGFGGGSSIDCAKAVGARIAKPHQSISKMKGILKIHKKIPLLIAIPTTAGTGSETTLAAVITDEKLRHKYPINDFPLIPSYAVLDPGVTRTLSKNLTATTGMDALTHAVEAFIGRSTTKKTRENAIKAVCLIFKNIEKAFADGNDMTARKNMLDAAFLAGDAFTKSYVGYCHAVAHTLGGKYNTPHGFANAVLLPYILEEYGCTAYKKLKILAVKSGLCKENTNEKEAAEIFIEKIKTLNKNMNIPNKFDNIVKSDIPTLAKYADKEGNPLYPVPKLMGADELEKFYYLAMKGE